MSSYFQIQWRDDKLNDYSTDKLYYIWNILKQEIPVELKQEMGRLKWLQADKKRQESIATVKAIIEKRPDKFQVREQWLTQHPSVEKAAPEKGVTLAEIAKMVPQMCSQLGAFIEIENIEIKYFDLDGTPEYELDDFKDIFGAHFDKSGIRNLGLTEEKFLALHPQVKAGELERFLGLMGCEFEKDGELELIPYRFAINAKRVLVDGDRLNFQD